MEEKRKNQYHVLFIHKSNKLIHSGTSAFSLKKADKRGEMLIKNILLI